MAELTNERLYYTVPEPEWKPPQGVKRRFHAMVKPIGAACNLDCTYCYYLSKAKLLDQQPGRRISDELLETFIRQYIEGHDHEQVIFSWQGGEPTLLGIDFFRKVVALEGKYRKAHQTIQNDLQTNGTLLDEDWCRFLRDNNFLVGLSIDGPRELHNAYRVTRGGEPTFDKVFAAAKMMKKHGVKFNTLTVVNRRNARRPLDVYRFLRREIGSTYIQFIPCVEPRDFETTSPMSRYTATLPMLGTAAARPGSADSIVTDWSVDPEDWGTFLCRCFDEWYKKDLGKVLVNLFETAYVQSIGQPAQICVCGEFCGKGLAVECDGSVFACDHYVYPDFRLGNIADKPISEMVFSGRQKEFGFAKRDMLPRYCRECLQLTMCWGECPKNRIIRTPDGEAGLNYLCSGQKRFFDYVGPHLKHMAGKRQQSTI